MDPYPICPKCQRPLKWNLIYSCGNPFTYFTCDCGYDTRNIYNCATSHTISPRDKNNSIWYIDWVRHTDTTKAK